MRHASALSSGSGRAEHEAARRWRRRRHVPAEDLDPLADADQSVAEPARRRSRPSRRRAPRAAARSAPYCDGHLGLAAAGVLEGVGEPLLHDAVRREVEGARQRDRLTVHLEPHGEPRGAYVVHQASAGRPARDPAGARAGRRPAACAPSRRRISASAVRPACSTFCEASPSSVAVRHPVAHRPHLQDHHADRVGDDVVELARDPAALLGHRHPGRRLPLPLGAQRALLRGLGPLGPLPQRVADEPADREEDRGEDEVAGRACRVVVDDDALRRRARSPDRPAPGGRGAGCPAARPHPFRRGRARPGRRSAGRRRRTAPRCRARERRRGEGEAPARTAASGPRR